MDFETMKGIIDDVVDFIKDFIAKLNDFINGFKKDITFTPPTTEAPEEEE